MNKSYLIHRLWYDLIRFLIIWQWLTFLGHPVHDVLCWEVEASDTTRYAQYVETRLLAVAHLQETEAQAYCLCQHKSWIDRCTHCRFRKTWKALLQNESALVADIVWIEDRLFDNDASIHTFWDIENTSWKCSNRWLRTGLSLNNLSRPGSSRDGLRIRLSFKWKIANNS